MADTNKKEYTSNLHPKGDLDTTVYPNVKSENIIDKDTTAYNAGKVPDSSLVSRSLDGLNEKIETNKIQTDTNAQNIKNLLEDLDAKQDKRFVHTVEIHYASNGSYFCFTGTSDKNTPIDSVQDLTTVFANRDLCGVGIFGSAGLSKIHVGSSVNDTTFKKYMKNGEYANPSEETFAMVFNTTGFTITDSVIPL